MGKIVKYCQSCDESFAEKFGFCPNCGKTMQAFEMNPVGGMTSVAEKTNGGAGEFASSAAPVEIEPAKAPEFAAAAASPASEAETTAKPVSGESTPDAAVPQTPVRETKTFAAAASNGNYKSNAASDGYRTVESQPRSRRDDDGFHVTVIEEKNVGQRNLLLLGALLLMMTIASGTMLYSLFNYSLSVAAIGDESGLSMAITDDVPMAIDMPKPKLDKNAGGSGGGGGGREDPEPVSKGELPPQFKEKPLLTPSKEDISVTNPAIRVNRGTQGPEDLIPKNRSATNGDPNSTNTNPSNGYSLAGTGMGQNGRDGIGNNGENGVGANGKGGRGIGPGNEYGNDGNPGGRVPNNQPPPPPEPPKATVTVPLNIISKPRATYTDAARTNSVMGVVRVRVTFLPSGQIGSVSPVSGLPYGLTEQAIAAAKSIKFEPMKKNGVAVTTSKVMEYTFTIY